MIFVTSEHVCLNGSGALVHGKGVFCGRLSSGSLEAVIWVCLSCGGV